MFYLGPGQQLWHGTIEGCQTSRFKHEIHFSGPEKRRTWYVALPHPQTSTQIQCPVVGCVFELGVLKMGLQGALCAGATGGPPAATYLWCRGAKAHVWSARLTSVLLHGLT